MATRILPSPRRAEPAQVLSGVTPFLPLLPFLLTFVSPCSVGLDGLSSGLLADVEDPLDDGQDGAHGDDPEGEEEDEGAGREGERPGAGVAGRVVRAHSDDAAQDKPD